MSQVLLVRHGQASWGAEDYDNLSALGVEQSRALGLGLAQRGIVPNVVYAGAMRRHLQTAEATCAAAGWNLAVEVDEGWNEFDHLQVLARHPAPEGVDVMSSPREFQRWFVGATDRWTAGDHDDYDESFDNFTTRVDRALSTAGDAGAELGTAIVFTSGGPMGWAAASALDATPATWRKLNQVTVNTGITTFINGSRGLTLLTVNEHAHLSPELTTYR